MDFPDTGPSLAVVADEAVVDEASCTECELCLDRCPVGAIAVAETVGVDRGKCLGCGVCATVCPTDAIRLSLRPDGQEPFNRTYDMGMEILRAKQANADKTTG